MRGTTKLSKKEEGDARKTLMNQLKQWDSLAKTTPKLSLNLSDILLFSTLSCMTEQTTQKALKGLKGLKQRWDELCGDEKAKALLGSYASRVFA